MSSELPDLRAGVVLHVEHVSTDGLDLVRLKVWINGVVCESHTLPRQEIGTSILAALVNALREIGLTSSAARGALAWSPELPVPTKQEAGQLVRFVAFFWRFVRAFLP